MIYSYHFHLFFASGFFLCNGELRLSLIHISTLNGEPVKLGVANFAARFGQAGADDFYTAYFGKNVWTSDLYGNGTTGQDNFKDSVMDSLEDMYVLQLHMDEYNVSITAVSYTHLDVYKRQLQQCLLGAAIEALILHSAI